MKKLLIIDDSKWTIEGLSKTIDWTSLDIEIAATCQSSAKACEILMNNPIDIILTDIRMTGMTGLDLAEYIKTNYPHIKLVLMSAFKEFDYAYKVVHLGVSGYLLKPILPQDLINIFNKISNQKECASDITPERKASDHETSGEIVSGTTTFDKTSQLIKNAKEYIN